MVLDSNILIYSATAEYKALLSLYVNNPANSISLITKLEVLGYHGLIDTDKIWFTKIFSRLNVFSVTDKTVNSAIALRQQKSMSVGDALIAATAFEYGLTLVTRNTSDFKWIAGLDLVNPFDN